MDQHANCRKRGAVFLAGLLALASVGVASCSAGGSNPRGGLVEVPEWWKPDYALPVVRSNCMRCHLKAGRELTAPLIDFAGSIHDLEDLSCSDCHGGNTADDDTAHEEDFGFIGNNLSELMAACAECHRPQASDLEKGKHFWDLGKGVNLDYPTCLDCHGHHDVGKPPDGFRLMLVCEDCHEKFETDMPGSHALVAENDLYWELLRKVRAALDDPEERTPESLRRSVDSLRAATARLVHPAEPVPLDGARELNARSAELRERLRAWLDRSE